MREICLQVNEETLNKIKKHPFWFYEFRQEEEPIYDMFGHYVGSSDFTIWEPSSKIFKVNTLSNEDVTSAWGYQKLLCLQTLTKK